MTHEMVILIIPIVQTEKQTTFSPLPLGQEAEFKSEQFNPTAYLPINRALIESQRERERAGVQNHGQLLVALRLATQGPEAGLLYALTTTNIHLL